MGGMDDEGGVDEIACGCAYVGLINCIADSREINTVEIPGKKSSICSLAWIICGKSQKKKDCFMQR